MEQISLFDLLRIPGDWVTSYGVEIPRQSVPDDFAEEQTSLFGKEPNNEQ